MTYEEIFAAIELKHVKLSQAKDGDLFIVRSPKITRDIVQTLQFRLRHLTGKRISVIGLGPDDDFQLMERSEAEAVLKAILSKP